MVVTLMLLSSATFLIAGGGAVLMYALSLWGFRAITPEELASVFAGRSNEETPDPALW